MRRLVVIALLLAGPAAAEPTPTPTVVHAELDPLPFATIGYGGQLGVRPASWGGVRLAVASFSLHVPGPVATLGGNAGFAVQVRPSVAAYALWYLRRPGRDGLAVGASMRYLRLRYTRPDTPDLAATAAEVSPEAIVGYQWHPWHDGFYLQPWFALGVTVHRSGTPRVDGHTYQPLPVSPFFTVNIGYELPL